MHNMYALTTGIAVASLAIAVAADIIRMKVAQTKRRRSSVRSIIVRLPLGFEGAG